MPGRGLVLFQLQSDELFANWGGFFFIGCFFPRRTARGNQASRRVGTGLGRAGARQLVQGFGFQPFKAVIPGIPPGSGP